MHADATFALPGRGLVKSARPRQAPARAALFARGWLGIWACLGSGPSCTRSEPEVAVSSATPSAAAVAAIPATLPEPRARLAIPEGSFVAGTEPGRDERRPELEPRQERFALGAFEIDARPYPGTGNPELGWGRTRARDACEARGGRLCTELEWERACKGPENQRFAGSDVLDAACASSPDGCRSGFGLLGMGSLREWTASDVSGGSEPLAALRGSEASGSVSSHRCAHRTAASALETGSIGFRCCYGPPNAARVQVPALGPTFTKLDLPVARLTALLAASPVTARLARELSYFPEPTGPAAVLAKGPGDRQGFTFTESPLLWNPVRGAEFLVVTARSGESTSFVAVWHGLGGDAYRLASSFVMEGETGPIAIAYDGYIRPRLHFSSCWGCPGETGKILYRDPDSAIVLQP